MGMWYARRMIEIMWIFGRMVYAGRMIEIMWMFGKMWYAGRMFRMMWYAGEDVWEDVDVWEAGVSWEDGCENMVCWEDVWEENEYVVVAVNPSSIIRLARKWKHNFACPITPMTNQSLLSSNKFHQVLNVCLQQTVQQVHVQSFCTSVLSHASPTCNNDARDSATAAYNAEG